MNYLLFYSGEIPDYINQTLDAIFKVEGESCKVYFCGDNELKRSDVEFIKINDLNNDYIKEVKNLKYFENESNLLWESSFLRIFYLYELAKKLKPSKRGEVEIVDLLNIYKKNKRLSADIIGRGGAWLDTGSIEDFYNTSSFVSALENRQGLKIACLEEIAFKYNWIDKKDIKVMVGLCLI